VRSNHISTRGTFLTSGMVPRGPDMGCHVAPYLVWLFKIIWSLWGSNPGPPAMVERLHMVWVTNSPRISSYYIYGLNIFKFELVYISARGSGWGLAPARGSHVSIHMTDG
jgi:hypothetical protein